MTQIPIPERTNQKIQGEFYPLQAAELIALKAAKLINNAAFVNFALKIENPFCDRPVTIVVKEFALKWGIPEVSVYKGIAKLKKLNILFIKQGKVTIEWNYQNGKNEDDANYQDGKKIINFDKKLSDPIENYQNGKNESLNPLPDKDSDSPQTFPTFPTPQTGGDENFFEIENDTKEESNLELAELSQVIDGISFEKKEIKEEEILPVRSTNKVNQSTPSKSQSDNLTPELEAQLKALKIPLDDQVKACIATHHPSQIKGALAHIEETSDEIRSPRGVFLYQVPRQEIDKRKDPKEHLTPEFREWYTKAIADGVVINRPIESLGLYQFREPIVTLPDGSQWPWTQVRDEKHLTPSKEELEESLSQHKKIIENLKANSPRYQSSQEKAKQQLHTTPSKEEAAPLPSELETQLKDLGIPLNSVVRRAIASHPLDVIEGIIQLVQEKLKAIGDSGGINPQKLFMYQLMTL